MNILAGTSGYSYKEWKGSFYPDEILNENMLEFYAKRLPTVEINNTFYRVPRPSVLETWSTQVPQSFRFAIKATRRITHIRRLKNASEETNYFLNTMKSLGEQLGVVLFQLPPQLRKDLTRLTGFLELLPPGTPAAFEFRHVSWFDNEVYELLKAHNFALCIADTDDDLQTPVIKTADWGYLRLRRAAYSNAQLKKWVSQVRNQQWERAFVFFKHEDEVTGPKLAARFLKLTG